jgi:hypothetical protein
MIATLWAYDLFDRDSPPMADARFPSVREGLCGLWRSVLHEGLVEDGRGSFTEFSLQLDDGARLRVPVQHTVNPELVLLRARQHEPGFLEALADVHLALHERRAAFEFEPFFAIPPPPACLELARVLANALSSEGAPRRTGARWKVGAHVELSCAPPGGWRIEVVNARFAGRPVVFAVQERFEGGAWHRTLLGDGRETQPLRDALIAAGLAQQR